MGKSMRETPTRQALLCLVRCGQMSLAQYISIVLYKYTAHETAAHLLG